MPTNKNDQQKSELHPRNKNKNRYDLTEMATTTPELKNYIQPNKKGAPSINFSDPKAVKTLNRAILQHYYGIDYWDFPDSHLCPPIPGRAEYIHHIANLLSHDQNEESPIRKNITCLDIGTGASCIYPIIGVTEYQWNFIASDIDQQAIQSAQHIVRSNSVLKDKIELRLQPQRTAIFKNILRPDERIELAICNPPFHVSMEEAIKGTKRKVRNLKEQKSKTPVLNFSGNKNELVYKGGELQFIQNMITESQVFADRCLWFSSLVSKEANLKKLHRFLQKSKPAIIEVITIKTGNKVGRILAWTYSKSRDRKKWLGDR